MSRLETSRYLFSEAVERNWDIQQYDIEQAFPTAHLPKPVYMEVPKLILAAHPELAGCYCKVTRALYGLCHSPRAFNKHLDKYFDDNGYIPSEEDPCLYLKYEYIDGDKTKPGKLLAAIGTFVDDVICTGPPEETALFRIFIKKQFSVRDLGSPKDYLGMQVEHDRDAGTLWLHQSKYTARSALAMTWTCPTSRCRALSRLWHTICI